MTYQETCRPNTGTARPGLSAPRVLARLGRAVAAGVRRLQYGQMVAVLNRLSDENLEAIGIARQDIRAHAHGLIYGTQ